MNTAPEERHRLIVATGAGRTYEVEGPDRYSGHVLPALERIAREQIRDPGLLEMLRDPMVVMETSSHAPEGDVERSLSPREEWGRVVEQLREGDVELSLARHHDGGSPAPH